jgi:recombination protein RecT
VVGYCAFFELTNGFKKTVYWPKDKMTKHAKRFSKSYSREDSVWRSDFDSMAIKTIVKSTLSKWGLLSIDQQIAISADQSVQKEPDQYEYPDNEADFDAYEELESEVKKKDEKPLI